MPIIMIVHVFDGVRKQNTEGKVVVVVVVGYIPSSNQSSTR